MGSIDEEKRPVRQVEEEQKQLRSSVKLPSDDVVQEKHHSIMELEGLGKEIWEGIDAQEYVNQERDAWDG